MTFVVRRGLTPWVRHASWTVVVIRLILPVGVTSWMSVQNLWPLIELAKSRMENRPETQILGDTSTRVFGSGLASTLPTEPAVPFQPATINNVLGQLVY